MRQKGDTQRSSVFLTGIKPTGDLHLGNYIGAMRPVLDLFSDLGNRDQAQGFLFVADGHALTSVTQPNALRHASHSVAAAWMAMGLDTSRVLFYRQSAVPQVFELFWMLSCVCPKGLMNRAHAYKAVVQARQADAESDVDRDVMMGLFNYPVLMAADILLFGAHKVPVGPDQVQHVEIARDLAQKFNAAYGHTFDLPEAYVPKNVPLLTGLDGRKMSKSYGNVIPLFSQPAALKKLIARIKTNSQLPHEPKDPEKCSVFQLFRAFSSEKDVGLMRAKYQSGIGWGAAKEAAFQATEAVLAPQREVYKALMADPQALEAQLCQHEKKAYQLAQSRMQIIRGKVGFAQPS